MAAALSESGVEEGEYESDSDGTSALALRRREASDDDERGMVMDAASSVDEEDGGSRHAFSDDEGEGEGIPPVDEEDEEEEEEEEEEDEDGLLRRRRNGSDEEDDNEVDSEGLMHHQGDASQDGIGHARKSGEKSSGGDSAQANNALVDTGEEEKDEGGEEEEKKDAEPFVVPTAGAFYMHDDRFRAVGGARPRGGMGGRKLWEAKDEKPWVHDLFEELNVRDENFSEEGPRRAGRGRSRGRGRVNRDQRRGWVGKLASDAEELIINRARRGRGRGRAPKTEVADRTRTEEPVSTTNTSGSKETQDIPESSNVDVQEETKQHESTAPLKKVAAGSLNSASPPFFPSGALQQKLVEGSDSNQAVSSQSNKGKDRAPRNPGSHGAAVFVAKPATGSGRGTQCDGAIQNSTQSQQAVKPSRAQPSQAGRGSSSQAQSALPPQAQAQPQQLQAQPQQSRLGPANSGQPARHKSNGGRGGRGGNYQVVGGGGPYMYNGGPAAGMSTSVRMGEPGFSPPIPAVGPVAVQYSAQPPAGMAVPAVGMAIPNYSGPPQFGYPNSEVAWVPVLAGGGAIGTGYAAPYMTMEGTPSHMYYTQPATQPASFCPTGREVNGSKPGGLWKPPQNQEMAQEEFGHRQSKPRRYSEMSFGQ